MNLQLLYQGNTPIYRWMKEEEHVAKLCKGDVFLSTLGICRSYENPQRGDKHEGVQNYFSGYAEQNSTKGFDVIAQRSGIDVRNSRRGVISNNVYVEQL